MPARIIIHHLFYLQSRNVQLSSTSKEFEIIPIFMIKLHLTHRHFSICHVIKECVNESYSKPNKTKHAHAAIVNYNSSITQL